MANYQNPAIELLVERIDELERKANAYRASVNVLCKEEGVPPMFPDAGGDGNGGGGRRPGAPDSSAQQNATASHIKPDAFYKKPQQTAVRELLSIRKVAGDGPAKPVEIMEGLRAGGYQFEAKSDEIALVGLRAMLRKRPAVFHKLPNGAWGLTEWYPGAKPQRDTADKATTAGAPTPKDAPATEVSDTTDEDVGPPGGDVADAPAKASAA